MHRTQSPRGRAASLALLAILFVLTAAPASAAGGVSVSVPQRVTGRDALVLTPSGLVAPVALTVTLDGSGGAAATWRVPAEAVANDRALALDLSLPDRGSAPRNGAAVITVLTGEQTLATAAIILDRAPPVPALQSVVRGQRVGLTWSAVSAADVVTYRLERIATGGAWATVQEGPSAAGYTDRALAPGRYRYRLSAALPAADGGLNWSALSAVQVKITAPAAPPSPTPATAKPADLPARNTGGARRARPKPAAAHQRPRSVAATGTVRGPVGSRVPGAPAQPAPAPAPAPSVGMAHEPAVHGAPVTSRAPAVAPPQAAGPAPAGPQVASPEAAPRPLQPFPVTVPPAGSLAVQAATRTPADPATLLTGFAFLMLAATVAYRLRGRGREGLRLIQAWVGRR